MDPQKIFHFFFFHLLHSLLLSLLLLLLVENFITKVVVELGFIGNLKSLFSITTPTVCPVAVIKCQKGERGKGEEVLNSFSIEKKNNMMVKWHSNYYYKGYCIVCGLRRGKF